MPRVLFVQLRLFGSDASKTIIPGCMYAISPPVIKERPKPLVEVVAEMPAAVYAVSKYPPLIKAFVHVCVVALNEEIVRFLERYCHQSGKTLS